MIIKRSHIFTCTLLLALQGMAMRAFAAVTLTAAQWQQLTNDKAFAYRHDIEKKPVQPASSGPGFLERMVEVLLGFFGNGLGRLLLWALIIAAVIFVVYHLLLSRGSLLFGRNNKKIADGQAAMQNDEDITATNWSMLQQQAAAGGDYRLATRYGYMQVLQLLQHRSLIAFSSDKTNFDYYTELDQTPYKPLFRQLSRRYEYAWYGHFTCTARAFDEYMMLFDDLKKLLGS